MIAQEPDHLLIGQEIWGKLESITDTGDNQLIATIGHADILLPSKLEPKLRPLIGQKIGPLRSSKDYDIHQLTFTPQSIWKVTANDQESATKVE